MTNAPVLCVFRDGRIIHGQKSITMTWDEKYIQKRWALTVFLFIVPQVTIQKGQLAGEALAKGQLVLTCTHTYDEYGRPENDTYSSGKTIHYSYDGLETTTTTNGKASTRTVDCPGKPYRGRRSPEQSRN